MNKRKRFFASILILVLFLTACGTQHYVRKNSIKAQHRDWAEQIGLFSHDNLKVSSYREENNEIEIELEYENGLDGYKNLCGVVNAHNKFVEENPGCFSDDIDIRIVNRYANEYVASCFYNRAYDELYDYSVLGRPKTAKIQYMAIDIGNDITELEECDDIEIDVPVVIIKSDYAPGEEAYSFLREFKKAEQVVIDYHSVDYSQEKACEFIRKNLPDVEIYSVVAADKQLHLEKCQ